MTASTDDLEDEIRRLERRLDLAEEEIRDYEKQLEEAQQQQQWQALLDYAAGFERPGFAAVYTLDALRAQLAHWDAAKKPLLVQVAA